MLLNKRDFRAIVFYEYAKGTSSKDCHESLKKLFGETAPDKEIIDKFYHEFKKNRAYLGCDNKEKINKIIKVTPVVKTEYVETARRLIRNDQRIQLKEFEKWLEISPAAIDAILDDHLNLTKRWDSWVPKVLNAEQKKDRLHWCRLVIKEFSNGLGAEIDNLVMSSGLWINQYDDESKDGSWSFDIKKSVKILHKRMIVCFFSRPGYILSAPLEDTATRITVSWLINTCLPRVIDAWRAKQTNKERELWLHHERTNYITAAKIVEYLHKNDCRLFPHPFYAPDLAPADFFLFPNVRKALKNQRFPSPEKAIEAYQKYVDSIDKETWQAVYKKWFDRVKKCQKTEGDYFEDLKDSNCDE